MAEQQQTQNQDSSTEFLWLLGLISAIAVLIWYFAKSYLITGILTIHLYELIGLQFILKLFRPLYIPIYQTFGWLIPDFTELQLWENVVRQNLTATDLDFNFIVALGSNIGNYMKYPISLLLLIETFWLYFKTPQQSCRNIYNTQSLRLAEGSNWPSIQPIIKLNLVAEPLDSGPWAMALSPMQFCKKHDLLEVIKDGEHYQVTVRRAPARQILALQLGGLWHGVHQLPNHLKALFAVFATRLNYDKATADKLLDQLASSAAKQQLDLTNVAALIAKYEHSKPVVAIVQRHAYITTILATMLVMARTTGVLAPAEFLWLKAIDRRFWYMFNTMGRPTAVAEICGAFAHLQAENKAGCALFVPMVDEAIDGLSVALSELIYKPDSETAK